MLEKLSQAYELLQTEGGGQLVDSTTSSLKWQLKLRRQRMKTWPQYWHRLRYRDSVADPYTLLEIDPDDVRYLVSPRFQEDLPPDGTYIVGGDWDASVADAELHFFNGFERLFEERRLVPLDKYVFFRSVKHHVQRGTPWSETDFYQWATTYDGFPDHILYGDEETRQWRFDQLDRLADSMRDAGYKSQRDCSGGADIASGEERVGDTVSKPAHSDDVPPEFHEVMINIARDGTLIFEEGRHRFAVARALELESVPVRIFVRHAEWQRKRREVAAASAVSDLGERTRRVLPHPDLSPLRTF